MELSFAALHQLLRPCLDAAGVLPPPQRTALRLAFGLRGRRAAGPASWSGWPRWGCWPTGPRRQPLLCLVDDAHWLDHESAAALAFLARRLYADSIAMVFAVREPAPRSAPARRAARAAVAGLAERRRCRAAGVRRRPGRGCGPAGPSAIVAETEGNPLALIEIGQELGPSQLTGGAPLPEPLPLGRQLEQRYLAGNPRAARRTPGCCC